jgi:hypothetical protein
MACNGWSIKLPSGDTICIPMLILEVKWRDPNPPDPPFTVFDDMRVLATIHQGIAHISDRRVRENLTQAVQAAAKGMSLPDGVKLGDGLFRAHATAAE